MAMLFVRAQTGNTQVKPLSRKSKEHCDNLREKVLNDKYI